MRNFKVSYILNQCKLVIFDDNYFKNTELAKAAQIFLQTIGIYQLYPSLILITKASGVIFKL